jgi:hypothetical protein
MALTWGNPHLLQPTQCVSNVSAWTDPTIIQYTTKVKTEHINELRVAIDGERARRGFSVWSWTDNPVTTDDEILATHMTEIRTAISNIKTGDCAADSDYCPEDGSDAVVWTDVPITPDETQIKKVHVDNARGYDNSLSSACVCESEQCEFCSDCGHRYSYCNHNGVACNDDQSVGGCGQTVQAYNCASINLAALTTHPYTSANPAVAWNGTVPWIMGTADRPASAWHDWDFYNPPGHGASDHSDWNCKCNPYTWTT